MYWKLADEPIITWPRERPTPEFASPTGNVGLLQRGHCPKRTVKPRKIVIAKYFFISSVEFSLFYLVEKHILNPNRFLDLTQQPK